MNGIGTTYRSIEGNIEGVNEKTVDGLDEGLIDGFDDEAVLTYQGQQ